MRCHPLLTILSKHNKALLRKLITIFILIVPFEDEDNVEMITTVVETCPKFLAPKDEDGMLPCHLAVIHVSYSAHKHLLLFGRIGFQHTIGGEESRGGLLYRNI